MQQVACMHQVGSIVFGASLRIAPLRSLAVNYLHLLTGPIMDDTPVAKLTERGLPALVRVYENCIKL